MGGVKSLRVVVGPNNALPPCDMTLPVSLGRDGHDTLS